MTENKVDYSGAGVYQIENIDNGSIYIGSAVNVAARIAGHLQALKSGRHDAKEMQKDFDRGDRFYTRVLQKIPVDFTMELRHEEGCEIEAAKQAGYTLYNTAFVNPHPYFPKEKLIKLMAEKYCRERFGVALGNLLHKCPAEIDMLVMILMHPEQEKAYREDYKEVIAYQNKRMYTATHKRG